MISPPRLISISKKEAFEMAHRLDSPFICTPYVPDSSGRLSAIMPDRCPGHAIGACAGTPCDLRIEYYRKRKTGPPHPVAVTRCRSHGGVFTLL